MDRSFRFRERDRMDARSLAGGSWCAFGGSNRRGGLGFEFGGTRFQPRVALSPRTHGFRSQDRRELHEIDAAAAGAGDHVVRRGAPPLLRRDFPVRRNDLCVGWELAGFLEVSHHVANACQRDGTGSSAAVVVVVGGGGGVDGGQEVHSEELFRDVILFRTLPQDERSGSHRQDITGIGGVGQEPQAFLDHDRVRKLYLGIRRKTIKGSLVDGFSGVVFGRPWFLRSFLVPVEVVLPCTLRREQRSCCSGWLERTDASPAAADPRCKVR
mmetsp:Transcript_19752/g.40446  ORF Transcript_19752/g.40446 Transcript_19752/m.40446 type:complete len:269 (+) Transcript_19752:1146-1952(+)